MKIVPYEYAYNDELYLVYQEAENWNKSTRIHFDSFTANKEGYVLISNSGEVAGAILYSDYRPGVDVIIHCAVRPKYQKRWLTRTIYKTVFDHVFIKLGLDRCSGFGIAGINDPHFHFRLGFRPEGIVRQLVTIQGVKHDINLFGMLKNERRW